MLCPLSELSTESGQSGSLLEIRPAFRPPKLDFGDVVAVASEGGTPISHAQIRRRRNSSFRRVLMSPSGRRRVTTGSASVSIEEHALRKAYNSMRCRIIWKAINTGMSLLITFLEYPVFLAYLFGFAKISQDPNNSYGPLYVLLLGPLRLGWQALSEWSLARADDFTTPKPLSARVPQ